MTDRIKKLEKKIKKLAFPKKKFKYVFVESNTGRKKYFKSLKEARDYVSGGGNINWRMTGIIHELT